MTFEQECPRCGYRSNKTDLRRHLKRKKLCKESITSMDREECLKLIENNQLIPYIELRKNSLKKDKIIEDLEKRLKQALKMVGVDNSINLTGDNNTNCNNTNINIININTYENTNYEVLKDNIEKCIVDGRVDKVKLIKYLHFNKDYPENHNVKIENRRENRIMTFNGKKFEEHGSGLNDIWDFVGETLDNTNKTLTKDNEVDDNTLVSIQNSSAEHDNGLNKKQTVKKLGQVLYNGKDIVNRTHGV